MKYIVLSKNYEHIIINNNDGSGNVYYNLDYLYEELFFKNYSIYTLLAYQIPYGSDINFIEIKNKEDAWKKLQEIKTLKEII